MVASVAHLNAAKFLREESEKYRKGGDYIELVCEESGPHISAVYSELLAGVNPAASLDKEQKVFAHKTVLLIVSSFLKDVQAGLRTDNIYWDPQVRQEVVQLLLYIHSCVPRTDDVDN